MTTKKPELIKLFFSIFNSDAQVDMDTVLVAIEAVMTSYWITWKKYPDLTKACTFNANISDNDLDYITEQTFCGKDAFDYLVNLVSIARDYNRFLNICEVCMNFEHMEQKIRIKEAELNNPY